MVHELLVIESYFIIRSSYMCTKLLGIVWKKHSCKRDLLLLLQSYIYRGKRVAEK